MSISLLKSYDVFKPESVGCKIHIIGCGSVGSTLAELLARYGITDMCLYDFDVVEPHNIANQMFRSSQIGMRKTDAVKEIVSEINPGAEKKIKTFEDGYTGQRLAGYVFLAVDNIDTRREIAKKNIGNQQIKAMFDCRTGLFDAQTLMAIWSSPDEVRSFLESMNFTHEEAMVDVPVSACNTTLSVASTIRIVCSICVSNFTNYVARGERRRLSIVDTKSLTVESY